MEKHRGFRYIIQAVDSLTGWPEARALTRETAETIGKFIFEELLCRHGAISEIVTDNGPPILAAVDWLSETYHINHIRISPYNSQAQGTVERAHLSLRESVIKACDGKLQDWPIVLPYCLWAQRVTTRKSTGHSPYYMAHGTEPLMPFDIAEATYLSPEWTSFCRPQDLIAVRAKQLMKREKDLEAMRNRVWTYRKESAMRFIKKFEANFRTFDLLPGQLALVRNSAKEGGLKNKYRPRYLGPYVVIAKNSAGAYTLAEMDGTISKLRFAAKRVIPYNVRDPMDLPGSNEAIENANAGMDEA